MAQATKTPLVSPSPSPDPISPTDSPSTTQITEQKCKYVKQATEVFDLNLITNLSDYTTILQFPEVEAARIQLDIVSNYRPRFSDPYSFASDLGQVAITNVLFYKQFVPSDLFNSGVTDRTDPESPSPSPSTSPTDGQSPSPSATPATSPASSATTSPSATPIT